MPSHTEPYFKWHCVKALIGKGGCKKPCRKPQTCWDPQVIF